MKHEDILKAQEEAERFIESVQEYLQERVNKGGLPEYYPSINRAAVKRRSMDLTRALSAMRNPK